VTESLAAAVAGALWNFATFLNAEEVLVLAADPEPLGPMIADALARPAA
jgi:hypothetical protein